MVWLLRRSGNLAVKGLAAVFMVALAGLVGAMKQGKLAKVISADGQKMALTSCGIAAVSVVAALVSGSMAYYAMWVLAIVVFGLAVYYTVKQL